VLAKGDVTVFVTRPISGVMLLFAALALIAVLLPIVRTKREEVFQEKD